MNSQGPEQQTITEAAAEWAVRLHAGALSEEAQLHLSRWLAADERHAPALHFAQQTWAALGELALEPDGEQTVAHRLRPESTPDGDRYLVMEWLDGVDRCARWGALSRCPSSSL